MNLIDVISTFLGSPSAWRITSRTGVGLSAVVGGGYWRLDLRDPSGVARSCYYTNIQVGANSGVSTDEIPADTVRAIIGRSGQVFRRIGLGRELQYDDFTGSMARAVSIGPLAIIGIGIPATIASVVLTGLPPASIAAQLWGSTLIGFVAPGTVTNPRVAFEVVGSTGLMSQTSPLGGRTVQRAP